MWQLRGGVQHSIEVDGEDPVGYATEQLDRMLAFADAVRDGQIQSSSGVPFTDVINIGIGGSDLGPRMAVEALRASECTLSPTLMAKGDHFVANVDGHDFELVTRGLDRMFGFRENFTCGLPLVCHLVAQQFRRLCTNASRLWGIGAGSILVLRGMNARHGIQRQTGLCFRGTTHRDCRSIKAPSLVDLRRP